MQELLLEYWTQLIQWCLENVLTTAAFIQWVSLGATVFFSWGLYVAFAGRMHNWLEKSVTNPILRAVLTLPKGVGFCLILLVLLQFATAGFVAYDIFPKWIFAASDISLAWIVIRYLTRIIPNRPLARIVAMVVWLAALMRIVGVLDYVTAYLQDMRLPLGETDLSAYGALKGLLMAALCLQLASFVGKFVSGRIEKVQDLSPSLQVLLSKIVNVGLYTFAILFALTSMGINLTSLAIFSSALGVGVGFGLRTIVSNYVAGVLLLLDNSIKPGDNLEISGVFGVVRNMHARYASVLTRDGKERLVPNELLISSEVINLTYSSPNIRLNIPVGISYDSDVNLAKELLESSADGVARVLQNPPPMARLIGFGDNSVDFELRMWIGDVEKGITNVKSEVLFNIWNLFKDNGISFPFPQRDVAIKPESSITVKVERPDKDNVSES